MIAGLRGAVVAVTGASAGIGRACAVAFGREGARVALAGRRLERLEAVAAEIRAIGSEASAHRVDVEDEAQVHAFVAAVVQRFGRLDVLVNNAGSGVRGRVEETPAADYDRMMRVNYLSTVYGCQAAIPIMKAQKSGVIVNVSSIVGHRAIPGSGAYSASKAAQVSLTEALRVELRGTGVDALTVHPIGTRTEFAEVAGRASGQPAVPALGPQQEADDVARAIVRGVLRPRPEVYPYRPSRAIVWLNALSPGLADWMAWRSARRSGRI
jgi:NADP-dependent 3-hydroxy acid dehydrogenase YdfG